MQQFILRKLITPTLLIILINNNIFLPMEPKQKITPFDFGKGVLQLFNNQQDICYTIINSMTEDAIVFGQTNKQNNAALKNLGWNNLLNLKNDPYHNLNFIRNNYIPIISININSDSKHYFLYYFNESNKPDITKQQYLLAISPYRNNFYTNLNDEQKNNVELWKKLCIYEQKTVSKFIKRKTTLNAELVKLNKAPILKISSYEHTFENGQPLTNQLFFCQNEEQVNKVLNQWDKKDYWVLQMTLFTLIQYHCYKNNAFKLLLNKAKNTFPNPSTLFSDQNTAKLMFNLLFYAKQVNNLKACHQLITIDPFNTVARPLNIRFNFNAKISHCKQLLDLLIENDFDQDIIKHFKECGGKTTQELEGIQPKKKKENCIIS